MLYNELHFRKTLGPWPWETGPSLTGALAPNPGAQMFSMEARLCKYIFSIFISCIGRLAIELHPHDRIILIR